MVNYMENNFSRLSVREIHTGYQKKWFTPVDVAKACIQAVRRMESRCHAWVTFDPPKLLAQAEACQRRLKLGGGLRPLEGIPVGIKDIFNTAEFSTQMGSPLWKDFKPGNDARNVFYVRQAGGLIPGKTVTAEFAVHTLDKTLNPHDALRTPGTSSSGSAVAIATGMVPVALGTQTAGSIVRPASFCGIYGCKPSFGLIPRTGMLKTTDSLDTVGYFVSYPEDLRRVFDVLRVHGVDYPISHAAFDDSKRQEKPCGRSWRIAFAKTHTWNYAEGYAQAACLKWVVNLGKIRGFHVEEVELPKGMEQSHRIHATIYNRTLAYYFSEEYKKSELVSPIMNDLIKSGQAITLKSYQRAIAEQERLGQSMDRLLKKYDALVSLSTAGEAPLRAETEKPDPALMWTLAGLPVVSAPVFVSPRGLPFGMQLVARRYNDFLLFQLISDLASRRLLPRQSHPSLRAS